MTGTNRRYYVGVIVDMGHADVEMVDASSPEEAEKLAHRSRYLKFGDAANRMVFMTWGVRKQSSPE